MIEHAEDGLEYVLRDSDVDLARIDKSDPINDHVVSNLQRVRERRNAANDQSRDRWSMLSKIGGNKKITIPMGITAGIAAIALVAASTGDNKNNSSNIPQVDSAELTNQHAFTTHTVQSGETLEGIAEADLIERASKQGFSLEPTPGQIDVREREIAAESGLENPDELMPGQVLKIPDASEVPIVFIQPD